MLFLAVISVCCFLGLRVRDIASASVGVSVRGRFNVRGHIVVFASSRVDVRDRVSVCFGDRAGDCVGVLLVLGVRGRFRDRADFRVSVGASVRDSFRGVSMQ